MIDAHVHLDAEQFATDYPDVIARALRQGVSQMVNVGVTRESSQRSVALAQEYESIYAVVGLHPHDNTELLTDEVRQSLEHLIQQPKVVGVGEIGLDYHWIDVEDEKARSFQHEVFVYQMELARRFRLPVVIHSRDAAEDTLEVIRSFALPKVVLHCYGYDLAFAEKFLALSKQYMISFTGILTFKNATTLQEVARTIPLNRIMLETDCPFLAPQKYRGIRNEPAFVIETGRFLAELRGVSFSEIDEQTTRNTREFFGF